MKNFGSMDEPFNRGRVDRPMSINILGAVHYSERNASAGERLVARRAGQ